VAPWTSLAPCSKCCFASKEPARSHGVALRRRPACQRIRAQPDAAAAAARAAACARCAGALRSGGAASSRTCPAPCLAQGLIWAADMLFHQGAGRTLAPRASARPRAARVHGQRPAAEPRRRLVEDPPSLLPLPGPED